MSIFELLVNKPCYVYNENEEELHKEISFVFTGL